MVEVFGIHIGRRSDILPPSPDDIGTPPSSDAIERLFQLSPQVEYIPFAANRAILPYLRDKVEADMKANHWRNRNIGVRAMAVSIGKDITIDTQTARIIDGTLVRGIRDAVKDGVLVEYPPVRQSTKRDMDVLYNTKRSCVDSSFISSGFADHAIELREASGGNPNIMPVLVLYNLKHPRVSIVEEKGSLGEADSRTIRVAEPTGEPGETSPILKVYVLNYPRSPQPTQTLVEQV